jgi:hypothetical protein
MSMNGGQIGKKISIQLYRLKLRWAQPRTGGQKIFYKKIFNCGALCKRHSQNHEP